MTKHPLASLIPVLAWHPLQSVMAIHPLVRANRKVPSQTLSPSVACRVAVLCVAVFVIGAPSTAPAAGVVGTGTAASCTDAALDAALAGGGLVTFDCGGPATIDISTGTGTKTITADTTVDGGGLIIISGGNSVGVFDVNPGINFTVLDLTIANGRGGFGVIGGGISNRGTLTVTNSTLSANSPAGVSNGGVGGTVTVTDSTFIGNTGTGGIVNSEGQLTVTNSTISGNSGGGISNDRGTLTVTNSTFSGNSAGDSIGGGIVNGNEGTLTVTNSAVTGNSGAGGILSFLAGPVTVTNSTITDNSGGGLNTQLGTPALLRNTIVDNNTDGEGSSLVSNCDRAITDGGHNLEDGTSCGFSAANGSLSNTDPQLDPAGLQDNGGPTETVALCSAAGVPAGCAAASPAIDAGDQAVCAAAPVDNLDQRGFGRPGTGHTRCSIGAYEADGTAPACTGDCDGNGMVAINELILGVNIALGAKQVNACPAFADSRGMVDIAQLIKGVNNALNGCGGSPLSYSKRCRHDRCAGPAKPEGQRRA